MDEYQHPLFFETRDLTDKEKEKIRRHFQKRRESGGGDCGKIEKVGDVYKISFKEQQDQERVLQRKTHNISLPGGDVQLTVSQTSSPQTQDQPSTSQSLTFAKPNIKCLEKNFKADVFLLFYLRDNPKAFKVLQKQLSAIDCTLELDFKEEMAVVRGNVETRSVGGFGGAAENWELQVDQIFSDLTKNYCCYHVLEPKQIEQIGQDPFSVFDDTKVYTENGYVVVVGETEVVKEKIAFLEESLICSSSGSPTTEIQSVGYTEQVSNPKEILHDDTESQILGQEVLNLQFPELVNSFDEILKMIGMTQTNVTLKASHFPRPCVLLSGPLHLVKETQQALTSALASLTLDTLVLDGPGALRYFQRDGKVSKELVESSCQVLIWEQPDVNSPTIATRPQSISSTSSFPTRPSFTRSRSKIVGEVNKVNLEIKICSLEEAQVNVLVAPMLYKQLTSTNVGKCLLKKGGNTVQSNFDSKVTFCTPVPGNVLEVDASSSLGCSKIFFIECMRWDGVTGMSVQALGNGLRRCLDLCVQQGFSSVAIPVIGPGVVLNYPLSEAVKVLTETICEFGLSSGSGSLTSIHIVIKPGYPDSEECFHEMYKLLNLNMNQGEQALFRSLTTDLDYVDINVGGGTKLQVVFGDITDETTDAVVNTTDFTNFHNAGVCKDILTVAGSEVEAELKSADVKEGRIFVSRPGLFLCKAIIHVCGEKDAGVIKRLVFNIIQYCENSGFTSVAIPALCAGNGGLDPGVVAGAILQGIQEAVSSRSLHRLTTIRLVLIKIDVFLTFKKEATQMFPTVIRRVSAPQLPQVQQSPVSLDLSSLNINTVSQQSAFQFLGLSRKDVDDAMDKLKSLYEAQCSNQTFRKEDLDNLKTEDMVDLQHLGESEGLYMQQDPSGNLMVTGNKDGVNTVIVAFNTFLHGSLRRKMRIKEEVHLYTRVVWCILGHNGIWERLPKTANHNLEMREITAGIRDAKGILWQVDLQNMEATSQASGRRAKLKRLENLADFNFPLHWDNMLTSEAMKIVSLERSSWEYKRVKEVFKRTAQKTVVKIERLQNIHLRRAYKALKKQLSDKNKHWGGAGEKFLYHGTTHNNYVSIMTNGFNRSFAGQNATLYGNGTYFAVNASYSANPTYSKPAADGSQLMFVARVLTGKFTQGQSGMKVPPPLDNQHPHNRYDSVVDRMDNPSMYVVFHDGQAYPEYLITFK